MKKKKESPEYKKIYKLTKKFFSDLQTKHFKETLNSLDELKHEIGNGAAYQWLETYALSPKRQSIGKYTGKNDKNIKHLFEKIDNAGIAMPWWEKLKAIYDAGLSYFSPELINGAKRKNVDYLTEVIFWRLVEHFCNHYEIRTARFFKPKNDLLQLASMSNDICSGEWYEPPMSIWDYFANPNAVWCPMFDEVILDYTDLNYPQVINTYYSTSVNTTPYIKKFMGVL